MSGEKRRYVSVEEQELRRLREQESRLRSVQQDLPERLNAVREQARREFQQRLAPLDQRAQRQDQQTQRLKSGLKDLEKDTTRRLQQQRQEFQTAVRESEYRQQQALQQKTNRLESAMRQPPFGRNSKFKIHAFKITPDRLPSVGVQNSKFTHSK